jgi:hypothetical protein
LALNILLKLLFKCQTFWKNGTYIRGEYFDKNRTENYVMNFEKFTIKSQEALQKSAEIAMGNQQQAIDLA